MIQWMLFKIHWFLLRLLGGVPYAYLEQAIASKTYVIQGLERDLKDHRERQGFIIDEREIFFPVPSLDGTVEEYCDEERALAVLLADGRLFCNERRVVNKGWEDEISEPTTVLYVLCNDLFYWASGDSEPLPNAEIGNLYRMYKANPRWGVDRWCCLRRKLRPQVPVVEMMKQEGVWDAELEALPAPHPS